MWAEFLNSILKAWAVVFQVFKSFFVWIFDHTWAFILSIFIPLMNFVDFLIETLTGWIQGTLDAVFADSQYSFDGCFDAVDAMMMNCFGEDLASQICKDVIYVFNFSDFIESCFVVVIPLLLSCIIYKVVKSWIPTVSSN